jgi:hypothetical protein
MRTVMKICIYYFKLIFKESVDFVADRQKRDIRSIFIFALRNIDFKKCSMLKI